MNIFDENHDFNDFEKPITNYLRTGDMSSLEQHALSEEGDNGGGVLLPESDMDAVDIPWPTCSMRQVANIVRISTPALEILKSSKGADAGWVQETENRDETASPAMQKFKIQTHELYAKPRATQRLLDDVMVDVDAWLRFEVGRQFATLENQAFTHGDGEHTPQGFLSVGTRLPGADTVQTLELFSSGENGGLGHNPMELILQLFYSLESPYRSNACWMMPRSLLLQIRGLKNGDHYVWNPATSYEKSETLLGCKIVINDDMEAPNAERSSVSLAFGDFEQGYTIVDRASIQTLRDPYSAKPYVEFYTTKRVGGDVVDFDAIKLLRLGE